MVSFLPRFIAIESVNRTGYLSYIRGGGEADGYLRFMEPQVTSPFAKFEVESLDSDTEDLAVHVRSCRNNKYWQRTYLDPIHWGHSIVTKSKTKEENESKDSCTLFKFIPVDPANNKFKIMHVQSGCYLCSPPIMEDSKFDHRLLAHDKEFDCQSADVFTVVDWSLLLILPRHVAFWGPNNKYLCVKDDSMSYFIKDDIGEETVACEILPTNDGRIRIKSCRTGKFFRCVNSGWMWIRVDDTSTDNVDTFFRAVKYDDQKIALINLGNNKFCKWFTVGAYVHGFAAHVNSVTAEAQIKVEEPVLTREIYDFKYDLHNSRVYSESVLVVAQNSATNFSDNPSALDVKLGYKDTRSSCWNTDISLKLDMKTKMSFDIPVIFEGNVILSSEFRSGVEWGKVFETTTNLETVHNVVVPPMSEVTVNLVATKGLCDVPFTYKQRDVLYDGSSVVSAVQGCNYYGSNYHSMKFEVRVQTVHPWSKK
ncbi:hypothetical protein V6N13_128840 [Hibiscus sabdariffa]|uniref:Agglutinin domain-containing protein n=2 Tax=Hibiscus sabdariffa TaxID=183260 RepID=A0ABR2ADC0_9ROSI